MRKDKKMQIVCGTYICKNFQGLTIIIYPSADNGKQKKLKKKNRQVFQ